MCMYSNSTVTGVDLTDITLVLASYLLWVFKKKKMYEAQTLFFFFFFLLLRRESIQVQPRTTDSRMGFHSGLMLKKLVSLLSPAREELGLKLATGDFGFSENLNKSIQYQ